MPKDEFDFGDPMELSGVVLPADQSTVETMCECFIEEYMRLGYDHHQVLALFGNPHYLGMRMVLNELGESYIRARISDVFALWGKQTGWEASTRNNAPTAQSLEVDDREIDPTGGAIPQLNY